MNRIFHVYIFPGVRSLDPLVSLMFSLIFSPLSRVSCERRASCLSWDALTTAYRVIARIVFQADSFGLSFIKFHLLTIFIRLNALAVIF